MSKCPCVFQPAIQLDCIMELISIVRSGELLSRKADVLVHIGCLSGSFGEYVRGTDVVSTQSLQLPLTLEDTCNALQSHIKAFNDPLVVVPSSISPMFTALIIQLIKLVIDRYL